jgi:serine/threonine protein phosphatase 1
MSLTYAIPDIHGRLDLLEGAIIRILDHSAGKLSTVVTLGDYVDRGPNSRQVIECLMAWDFSAIRLVSLKGNHEAMMWEACNNLTERDWWEKNGGDRTLESYRSKPDKHPVLCDVPRSHLEWIEALPLMHIDEHRIFVHASVDPTIPIAQQTEQIALWRRYPKGFSRGHGGRHVVHGHHADPQAPVVRRGKTNLDGLAWKTGRLVIGVFDDERPGAASEFLEVVGPPHQI